MFVNDDWIILLSLCQPMLDFTFTPNRWVQFVAAIMTIANIIRLNPYERKAIESRRHGLFRKHLGEGYFIVVMYHNASLVLDFRQPCIAPPCRRRTFPAIFLTRKVININLQDEWEYLRSFRVYTITTGSLLRFCHRDADISTAMVKDVVWEGRLARSVIQRFSSFIHSFIVEINLTKSGSLSLLYYSYSLVATFACW